MSKEAELYDFLRKGGWIAEEVILHPPHVIIIELKNDYGMLQLPFTNEMKEIHKS